MDQGSRGTLLTEKSHSIVVRQVEALAAKKMEEESVAFGAEAIYKVLQRFQEPK